MLKDKVSQTSTSPIELLGLTVFGRLIDFDKNKMPVIIVNSDKAEQQYSARSCVKLRRHQLGAEVVLLMVGGNKPVILGVIEAEPIFEESEPVDNLPKQKQKQVMKVDGQNIEFTATDKLALKCGQAQITLDKKGKVEIKGRYIRSRAKKANRIQGGSVELN